MRILKSIRIIAALILTLTTIALVPMNTVGAVENTDKYVSEVFVAYGKDADEAKKTLEDKGFTPVEGNLNDGGKTYAMLGYKTTNDIRDSITDLAAMNMRGDYSVENYKNLLKSQKTAIAAFLDEFMIIIKEYRSNLKDGKSKAKYVHDMLNNYVDDDTKMKMGDLLNSTTLQDKVGVSESIEAPNPENLPNLVTILMQGNTQVIKSIETLLSMATDTTFNTWVDRFADLNFDNVLGLIENARPDLNTEAKQIQYANNVYGETADLLALQSAELGKKLNDYAYSGFWIKDTTEEEIRNKFGDIDNDPQAISKYQQWLSIAMLYENLYNYEGERFKKTELLSFFTSPEDYSNEREIYIPMAFALSEGQRYGLPFVDLEQLLKYAFTTEDGWEKTIEQSKEVIGDMKEVSVYQNVDRNLYKDDGTVALTGAAQRAKNIPDGSTGTEQDRMDTFATVTVISWVAAYGCAVAAATLSYLSNGLIKGFLDTKKPGEYVEILKEVIYDNNSYAGFVNANKNVPGGAERILKADNARLADVLADTFKAITLVVAMVSAVLTVLDLLRDKTVEQLPIPKYLVNNYTDADGGSYALNYKAVECNRWEYFGADYKKQKGSSADLMADEGKQWLALYASKNSMAGRPLTPDFVIQESNKVPGGYEGSVHLIGEKGAVNVVSGAFKQYSTLSTVWQNIVGDYSKYIFTKLSDDIKTYDESEGNMTASSMGSGTIAIIVAGSLIVGGALGAVITVLVNRNKKKKETEATKA